VSAKDPSLIRGYKVANSGHVRI